jgi:hypothetical protein
LVIQSVSQAQTLDAVLLGVGLLLAGGDQGQATASLTLVQHHHLTIQSGAQAQATEGLQLGVIGQLGIQSVSQGQGTDAPLLGISLIIQSASQAQTTDAVTYSTWRVNLTVLSNTPTPTLGLRRQPSSSPLVLSNTDGTMLSVTRRLTLTQTATSQTASLPLGIIRRLLTTMLGVSLTSTPALIGYRLLTANGEVTVITSDSDAPVIDRQLTSNGLTVSLTPLITLIVTGRTWAQGRVRIRFRTR